MEPNKELVLKDGVLTTSMNLKTREFKEFQLFLKQKSDLSSEQQKLRIELLGLQIKMEDYLNSTDALGKVISVGDFLRLYLDKLNIKQNAFAKYIGIKPSNLSKILSGSRKVNFELSFILSRIFRLDPKVWMLIQLKNEFTKVNMSKEKDYMEYKLEDLIRA